MASSGNNSLINAVKDAHISNNKNAVRKYLERFQPVAPKLVKELNKQFNLQLHFCNAGECKYNHLINDKRLHIVCSLKSLYNIIRKKEFDLYR